MTNQTTSWATPYGVAISATMMEIDGKPEPMIDAENTAIMLGIHDPEKRRGFSVELRALMGTGGSMDAIVEKFGGGKVMRIPISPPVNPICPTMTRYHDFTDNWVNALTDEPQWCDRAEVFLGAVEGQIARFNIGARDAVGGGLSGITTMVLECLGETEVCCLEAAALYALTFHDPWRTAGREWLLPHRRTWVHDWIMDRPVYRRLARLVGMVHRDVPSWLKGV